MAELGVFFLSLELFELRILLKNMPVLLELVKDAAIVEGSGKIFDSISVLLRLNTKDIVDGLGVGGCNEASAGSLLLRLKTKAISL